MRTRPRWSKWAADAVDVLDGATAPEVGYPAWVEFGDVESVLVARPHLAVNLDETAATSAGTCTPNSVKVG